jgi:hypothetical protein
LLAAHGRHSGWSESIIVPGDRLMRTIPSPALALLALALLASVPARAGVATAHRISFQGLARNASNQPVVSGDVRVRIYDAPTGGTLVYDSGTEFNGAVVTGVFSVVLGSGTALMLDNTLRYHLELDVNGQEVVGDAASGRQAFWPTGGDESRPDLEGRIAAIEAQVFAVCSGNDYDLNRNPADGCEFILDPNGIYVDANDPCRSIARGLTEAASTGRTTVYVANGTYPEAVTLANGKNLLGGFASLTWERHVDATNTLIRGESISGNHKRAVVGANITNPTLFEGFVVYGPIATASGGNSYAVYLTNAGGLTLRSNVIYGGVGGSGADGGAGAAGTDGAAGTAGANSAQSPTTGCSVTLNRSGGAGGSLTCTGTNVSGGAGGGNACPVVTNSEASGSDGVAGANGGGAGGDAGEDGALNGSTCTGPSPAPATPNGANGSNGSTGSNAPAVGGATSGVGTVSASQWVGQSGTLGLNGTAGRGGGGGGAGGGANATSPDLDIVGGSGGGGGSGGCGGTGGAAGLAGGGSFGIFIAGGSVPTVTLNTIVRGVGGVGGRGGSGGRAGLGGVGAAGGLGSLFCSGAGGRGGDGGAGGHGGGGGGGAGGISCGILTFGMGTPSFSGNGISGGAGGLGGPGGLSLGNAGGAGVAGSLTSVTNQ